MPPFSDYLPVGAIANDKNGKLLSVALYLDNRLFTNKKSETGQRSLTTSFTGWFYSPGTYTFYAEATTTDGLTFKTEPVTVKVYSTTPSPTPTTVVPVNIS